MKSAHAALTAKQAMVFDRRITDNIGIPALVLMENAGRDVADAVSKLKPGRGRIAVICGKGNNGGDGFVAARHMAVSGLKVDVYLVGRSKDLKEGAAVNWRILESMKICRLIILDPAAGWDLFKILRHYPVIVDALFGVGLNAAVGGIYSLCVEAINKSGAKVISVDIPSGLDATSGKVLGICVKADITVTFLSCKSGMLKSKGRVNCGRIIVSNLGAGIGCIKKRYGHILLNPHLNSFSRKRR